MTKKEKKNIKKEVDRCCWRAKERKTTRIKFIECVNPIEKILILTISKWEIKRNAKKKKQNTMKMMKKGRYCTLIQTVSTKLKKKQWQNACKQTGKANQPKHKIHFSLL